MRGLFGNFSLFCPPLLVACHDDDDDNEDDNGRRPKEAVDISASPEPTDYF